MQRSRRWSASAGVMSDDPQAVRGTAGVAVGYRGRDYWQRTSGPRANCPRPGPSPRLCRKEEKVYHRVVTRSPQAINAMGADRTVRSILVRTIARCGVALA